jgi:hypothetical protein
MEKRKNSALTMMLSNLFNGTLIAFLFVLKWLGRMLFALLPGIVAVAIVAFVVATMFNASNMLGNVAGVLFGIWGAALLGSKSFSSWGAALLGSNTITPIDTSKITLPSVEPFNELSQLTTMRYNYANIVTISTEMPPALQALYGSSLALVAVGHIEAGVDMGQMTQEDIAYDGETRTLTLNIPAPTLTTCYLDTQRTYVADQRTGVFASNQPRLNDESRRYALRRFRDMAQEEGILADAQAKAEAVVKGFAETLVNAPLPADAVPVTVVVTTKPAPENAPLVETCR